MVDNCAQAKIYNQTQKMPYSSVFASSQSQKRWIEHMRQNYNLNHGISPCVLQVPESLRDTKPEAYVPQIVGLGPYHHFRPEVQQMEKGKRAAVISYLKDNNISDNISKLVEKCSQSFEPTVRSCYDGYLDLDKETLAWVVIVDGLFLLYFLSTYLDKSKTEKQKFFSNIEALLPDIMMLENQIPVILMGETRKFLDQSYNVASDRELKQNIHDFCEMLSPLQFATDERTTKDAFDQNNHMLHYMYKLIVENQSQSQTDDEDSQSQKDGGSSQRQKDSTTRVRELAKEIRVQAGEIFEQAIEEFNTAFADANLAGLKVSENVEKISNILRNLQKTLHLDHVEKSLGNQIEIPSASRLNAIPKLQFKPLPYNCGIGDIKLENKTLHLPVITLNSNSEVILRNLVAYESTSKIQSTKLRDYMNLICGIIKSEKDVALLKKEKIVKGQLSDAEIVRICNGIKKSDEKSDESSNVHQIVTDVKEEFNNVGIVKACRSTTKCFAVLVKCIKLVFPTLVLLFLAMQSICEIYDCRRSSHGGAALRNSYLGELELDSKSKLMLPRKLYRY